MAADFNQEIDGLIQMIEEMLKFALRMREEQKQAMANGVAPTAQSVANNMDTVVEQFDQKMKNVGSIKKDMAYQLNKEARQQDLPQKQPVQQPNVAVGIKNERQPDLAAANNHVASQTIDVTAMREKEELALLQEKEALRKSFNAMKIRLSELSKEMDQLDFKSPTALARFGHSLIKLDNQIKELGNRITDFVKSVPENAKISTITFLATRLDALAQSVSTLKDNLNDKIREQPSEAVKPEQEDGEQTNELGTPEKEIIQTIITKEQPPIHLLKPNLEPESKTEPDPINQTNTKTAKELLTPVGKGEFFTMKDLILMNVSDDLKSMGDSIEECSRKAIEASNFIGLQTEIDPNVTSLESMAGNEQSGIRTVPSVKDELEDITLSEYSDDMEAAYQNGFDTDPNIATAVTDEEWANQHDEEYANQQPERMVFDPWEQER